MSSINNSLVQSGRDLHQMTTVFTNCMAVQQQVLQKQLEKEMENDREKLKVRGDPLFNLFSHEWESLTDDEQKQFFNAALDIMGEHLVE